MKISRTKRLAVAGASAGVLLASVLAIPSANAAAQPLSVKVSASSVTVGSKVKFSGKVADRAKKSPVSVQYLAGKTWKTAAKTKTTNAKGAYKITVTDKWAGHTAFRVNAPKTSNAKAVHSPKKYVDGYRAAKATLTSPASVRLAAGTNTTTITGKVSPADAGTTVTLQRLTGKTWASAGSTTVTKNGTFSRLTNTVADGSSATFRFAVAQAKYVRSATTGTVTVTVAAAPQQQPTPTPTPTTTAPAPTPTTTAPAPAPTTPASTPTAAFVDCATSNSDVPTAECQALVDIYDATDGPQWPTQDNWKVTTDVCTWYGVTCTSGHVTGLRLSNDALSSLPPVIGNLTSLTFLDLGLDQLTTLPPEIGNLTGLTSLGLEVNQLTTLPPEIGNLTSLTSLDLHANQLTALPPEIGNLTNLTLLYLEDNQLSSLPLEIGNLTGLRMLDLWGNQLTALPPEIGNLAKLTDMPLDFNQLSTLPSEIGNLANLTELTVQYNQLSTLPSEIGNLTGLTQLHLNNNQLTGAIPDWIGSLTNLTELDLGNNQLTGAIPDWTGNLANLTQLHLESNQLAGPIPSALNNTKLALDLSGNGCLTTSDSTFAARLTLDYPGWNSGCSS